MSSEQPEGRKSGYLRQGEGEALLLAVPPLAVVVLAQLLFELSAFDLVALGQEVAAHIGTLGPLDLPGRLEAADERTLWILSVFLNFCPGIALTIVAVIILSRSVHERGVRFFVPITLVLIVGGIGSFIYASASQSPLSGLFSFTYGSISAAPGFTEGFLGLAKLTVVLLNGLSIVAPVTALMAACSTLAPPREGVVADIKFLSSQVKSLKALVVIGSIYMVTGVVNLGVWLRWPAMMVDDEALAAQILNNALAMSVYWGGAFTVLIAAFYAPTMVALNKRAEAAITQLPDSTGGLTPKKFLEDHGLSLQVSKQLPQIAAVLAPLLAGPIGTAVIDLSKALPTG